MSHGSMDMNGSSNSSTTMTPWLHFTSGDTLLFQNWVPTGPGPVFGACIGLFMLAIVDRWLAAVRRFMEIWWAERSVRLVKSVTIAELNPKPIALESQSLVDSSNCGTNLAPKRTRLASPKMFPK